MLIEGTHSAQNSKFALIVSRFNNQITDKLLVGATDCLLHHGARNDDIDVIKVPGALEIPIAALKAAQTKKYDAIICLGTVIRGHTPHFEYVAGETTRGVGQVGLQTGVPTIFGVLTTNTLEDAVDRAGSKESNKGWQAAMTAMEMIDVIKKIL